MKLKKIAAKAVNKPNSVPGQGCPYKPGNDHSSGTAVARRLLRPTRELGRAALNHSSIWSCTGWGLHSFSGHPKNWCALTAPFHPYPVCRLFQFQAKRSPAPEISAFGRYTFCCTFLHVAATPRYGAPCPAVFGLSSKSDMDSAIVWTALTANLFDAG